MNNIVILHTLLYCIVLYSTTRTVVLFYCIVCTSPLPVRTNNTHRKMSIRLSFHYRLKFILLFVHFFCLQTNKNVNHHFRSIFGSITFSPHSTIPYNYLVQSLPKFSRPVLWGVIPRQTLPLRITVFRYCMWFLILQCSELNFISSTFFVIILKISEHQEKDSKDT